MKKHQISKLFLYRHRYSIVYALLGLIFIFTLSYLPSITPNGLSQDEMASVVTSNNLHYEHIISGDIVNLPYHLLQKLTLSLFGLTTYGIKLPSIIFGGLLGVLFILLLNRWFKNNVAILASIIAVLSSSFLYISGSGTPLIMTLFWPTLLFWLGSKIQGENKPKPFYSFIFAIALLLSLFTPYMLYLALFIVLYALLHPHLRFTITHLPKLPLFVIGAITLATGTFIIINATKTPDTIKSLLFMSDFTWPHYFKNIKTAFLPFFKWSGMVESTFLAPLVGLASLALAITGLISTYRGFFASRNSIATYLILFTIIISGFNPYSAILLLLPLAILIAHGFRYILNSWYGLFPENPYARIFGVLPITVFLMIMIVSDLSHFVFGYRYNPAVANEFSNDLSIIQSNLSEKDTLVVTNPAEYDFYKILEQPPLLNLWHAKKVALLNHLPSTTAPTLDNATTNGDLESPASSVDSTTANGDISSLDSISNSLTSDSSVLETATSNNDTASPKLLEKFVSLGSLNELLAVQDNLTDTNQFKNSYNLTRIVTNSKAKNSDRLYFYTLKK